MPEVVRLNVRMTSEVGLDLVHPLDRMPNGSYPYLSNARVIQEGRIDARPGYSTVNLSAASPSLLHSIRRLNDSRLVYATDGYTYIVGNGTYLQGGPLSGLGSIDTGFSGSPLSLIPFRPENSPVSWMYVYDGDKLVKVRPDLTVRPVGVTPPTSAPSTRCSRATRSSRT